MSRESNNAPNKHILLVEDEPNIQRALRLLLQRAGYSVEVADTGEMALECLDRRDYDVILSDINFPGMSGLELLRVVRNRSNILPVILITGAPSIDSAREAITYGAFRYLLKPFASTVVLESIAHATKFHEAATEQQNILRLGANLRGDEARALGGMGQSPKMEGTLLGGQLPPSKERGLLSNQGESVADRLQARMRKFFVGRRDALAVFEEALTASQWPFHLLHISGSQGIGKSTLIEHFGGLCGAQNYRSIRLRWGSNRLESIDHFLEALRQTLGGIQPSEVEGALWKILGRWVLFIDVGDIDESVLSWLRYEFLPRMPSLGLVVLASRAHLPLAWRASWVDLIRHIPLHHFSREESLAYLKQREVSSPKQHSIASISQGHPLALSLLTEIHQSDSFSNNDDFHAHFESLLHCFCKTPLSPQQQKGLEAASLMLIISEDSLSEVLLSDAQQLFGWLCSLPFTKRNRYGLTLHPFVREALRKQLQWRNPTYFRTLLERLLLIAKTQLEELTKANYRHALNLCDLLFQKSEIQKEIQPSVGSYPLIQFADVEDISWIQQRLEEQLFPQDLIKRLMLNLKEIVTVRKKERSGFFLGRWLVLNKSNLEELSPAPAMQFPGAFLQRRRPLKDNEQFLYQDLRNAQVDDDAFLQILLGFLLQKLLCTPFSFVTIWQLQKPSKILDIFFSQTDLQISSFGDGIHKSYFVSIDWRSVAPQEWLQKQLIRTFFHESPSEKKMPPRGLFQGMTREAFEGSILAILRGGISLRTPLKKGLSHAQIIAAHVGPRASQEQQHKALWKLIILAAKELLSDERSAKIYHALKLAFFEPAPSHEIAAERLGISLSTFKRHLKKGVTHIVQVLWMKELYERES